MDKKADIEFNTLIIWIILLALLGFFFFWYFVLKGTGEDIILSNLK